MTTDTQGAVSETMMRLVDGNVGVRVLSAGAGTPVLFLHGGGSLTWTPFLSALAERYRVVAPEHPPSSDLDYLAHLRDVWDLTLFYDELADSLDLDEFHLIGHSFGGMAAAELAAHRRRGLRSLSLIAPIGIWRDDAPIPDLASLSPDDMADRMLADPDGPLGDEIRVQSDPAAQPERERQLAGILHYLWPLPDRGLRRRLYRITAPTMLVWGKADRLVAPVYADEFASRIRDSRVELIENAGHLPMLETPLELGRLITDFISRAEAGQGTRGEP
jgi:pimeloyl-ACP methyl ester carboxylesterase